LVLERNVFRVVVGFRIVEPGDGADDVIRETGKEELLGLATAQELDAGRLETPRDVLMKYSSAS
jgi:hypothetical protein